ncbi:LegC family aminotransferase [Litorivivens sp.]|uniref:LegC family aminotransferase n=1 Tax=Litorivivens sp. TaxID=2020868 RepID=UPI00356270C1
MIKALIDFVREQYHTNDLIPLHAPVFAGHERRYVLETIDSTFVSSVGTFVDRFERNVADYTGNPCAVATVNGTAALHVALRIVGVQRGDLVITQPLTFVATCNAIAYLGAEPVFVDVDRSTLGLSPSAVESWLEDNAELGDEGVCRTKNGRQIIRACVPMHTFGHPVEIDELIAVCQRWNIAIVEDAAESLGSLYKGKHTGTFGQIGVLSFNGNKIITTGGGGMVLADQATAARAKHLTTIAKVSHPYEYYHDSVGYNYRMPNLNAALGCGQLEMLPHFLDKKRALALRYQEFFKSTEFSFVREPRHARSNYWLNAVITPDAASRDALLKETNASGVMTRPIWTLMNKLPMYRDCVSGSLARSEWLQERVVNLPSSVF